ncbi:MAG: hypothetical protein KAS66_02705 [Candidatus Omnitrophica bacterium]|nr:hypothetical protein [Candidatus Omnitrophota bacterium]
MIKKIRIDPVIVLLGIGVMLRAVHYLDNLSFWADEAWVALNLTRGSIQDALFNMNLNRQSIPPVGFLLSVKMLLEGFGNSEYAFRFFSFFCGLLSLGLYARLVKDHFETGVQYTALVLFVFSGPLIFYSAQLKQYSSDVAVAVVLYYISFAVLRKPLNLLRMVCLTLVGFLSVCLSHSAIFVLSAIAISHMLFLFNDQNKAQYAKHISVYLLWFTSFLLIYFLYFHAMFESEALGYQKVYFLSLKDLRASLVQILRIFKNPLAMSFYGFGFPIFVLGVFSLFKKNKNFALQMALPVLLAIAASFLNKYPFHGRFLLFLLPALFLFLAEGFYCIYKKGRSGKIVAISLMFLFFIQPAKKTFRHIFEPRSISQTRPLMRRLKEKQIEGDLIYINKEAHFAFWYYARYFKYPYVPRIIGVVNNKLGLDNLGKFILLYHNEKGFDSKVYTANKLASGEVNPQGHSLAELEGRGRVWILFSQIEADAEEHFLECIDEKGTRVEFAEEIGAGLYLYYLN